MSISFSWAKIWLRPLYKLGVYKQVEQPSPGLTSLVQAHQHLKNYVYDIPETDYIASTMKRVPVFAQDTTPRLAVIKNHGGTTFMHIKTIPLLYLLHRLNVRPPL